MSANQKEFGRLLETNAMFCRINDKIPRGVSVEARLAIWKEVQEIVEAAMQRVIKDLTVFRSPKNIELL